MKILFVTYDIPYPLDAGGKVRAYNLIRLLSRKHEVTLFTYYRTNDQLDNLLELKKFCTRVRAFKRTPVFSAKHFSNIFLKPNLTSHIAHYFHPELKKEIAKELQIKKYEVLHLESFYASHLLGDYTVKQILGTENIEWNIYMKHAQQQQLLKKMLLSFEANRTKDYEIKTWKKADAILAVSESDVKTISKRTDKPVYLIPNGVDTDYIKFKPSKTIKSNPIILFVGDFSYIQNQDAAGFMIREILPLIKEKISGVQLLLVGKNIPSRIQRQTGSNIIARTDVKDIREAYYSADILVAPVRVASGTQFKLLEAMAAGLPVVASPNAAGSLRATDNVNIIVGNTSKEVADGSIDLLTDMEQYNRIATSARKLVQKNYGWKKIEKQLLSVYATIKEN